MQCSLPVYPWCVHCLFIHAVLVACLSMMCLLSIYVSLLLCTLSTYHVCISLFNHATHKKSFRHFWLFLIYWLQVSSKMVYIVCPLQYLHYIMSINMDYGVLWLPHVSLPSLIVHYALFYHTEATMIPAKTQCPSTWTMEYSGYLMHYALFYYTEATCTGNTLSI